MLTPRPKRVLISIFHDVRGGRAFIREFAASSREWPGGCMLHVRSPIEGFAELVKPGYWDGMVLQLIGRQCRKAIAKADCPLVLIDPRQEFLSKYDCLELGHGAVGQLAAQHLLETGRKNFAMLGFNRAKLSERREVAFVRKIREQQFKCPILRVPIAFAHPRTRVGDESLPVIRSFLQSIGRPGAIFCANDELARVLLEAAQDLGIDVPNDIAILGADDDDLLCQTCTPTISSVRMPYHVAGAKAAQLLARRWRDPLKTLAHVVIPPTEVVTRDSTRVVSGEDRLVEEAMRLMHLRFSGALRMGELASAVGLGISALERRFKIALASTPMQELRKLRLNEAKRLLAETNTPIGQVADRCGFGSSTRFCIAFREETGGTPSDYRRIHKAGGTIR